MDKMINSRDNKISHDDCRRPRPNIAVMEFLYHWDYFITTVEVLKNLANVFLIVGENFKNHLERHYRFRVDEFSHMIVQNLNWPQINAYVTSNCISKIFVPTVQGFEFTYAFSHFDPPVPYYFTIHNFDLWLGKRCLIPNGDGGLIAEVNRVNTLLCSAIIRRSDGIITIDENLRDHLTPLIKEKKVYVMPWKVNRELLPVPSIDIPEGKEIIFTVPASIDRGRRNYGVVLETFKELSRTRHNIKLVLLGRPTGVYGREMLDKSRRINKSAGRQVVEYFDGFIHQDIYDDRIKSTDYFILPLENLDNIGKYKSSAAMYDALLAGRPILVPHKMVFSRDFITSYGEGFIVYEDLKETIEDILAASPSDMETSLKSAVENANAFFIDNQVNIAAENFFNEEDV
jgi:glycosyltransferase involved in cell wall biosynthesis